MMLAAFPAHAGFRYVGPDGPRPGFTEVAREDPSSLGRVLRRLAPPGLELRFDRRVDTALRIDRDWEDWSSLLHGIGLAADRHGGELHVRPAGISPGDVELVTAAAGRAVWRVNAGESLRETLDRWGRRAGCRILVLTDRRYRIAESRTWRGLTFSGAVRTLLFGLSHLPHPPAAELSGDGDTLVVTHRLPPGARAPTREETSP